MAFAYHEDNSDSTSSADPKIEGSCAHPICNSPNQQGERVQEESSSAGFAALVDTGFWAAGLLEDEYEIFKTPNETSPAEGEGDAEQETPKQTANAQTDEMEPFQPHRSACPELGFTGADGTVAQGSTSTVDVSSNSASESRIYLGAKPSRFCHICQRKTNLVPCANLQRNASCRKSICSKCFQTKQIGSYVQAKRNLDSGNPSWVCTHCTRTCPPDARCKVYHVSIQRRRLRKAAERLNRSGDS